MLYQLMNKDVVVATYEERMGLDEYLYDPVEQHDSYTPYGFIDVNSWIERRRVARRRAPIERLMRSAGIASRHDFINKVHCLSLTDTFWMKREDEPITWDDVSLYRNFFDDTIARIAIARAVMTPDIKAKLIELKDFEYTDPGFDYPRWKLDAVNRLKDRQIKLLLE